MVETLNAEIMKALCTSRFPARIAAQPPASSSALIPFREALSAGCENITVSLSFPKQPLRILADSARELVVDHQAQQQWDVQNRCMHQPFGASVRLVARGPQAHLHQGGAGNERSKEIQYAGQS